MEPLGLSFRLAIQEHSGKQLFSDEMAAWVAMRFRVTVFDARQLSARPRAEFPYLRTHDLRERQHLPVRGPRHAMNIALIIDRDPL